MNFVPPKRREPVEPVEHVGCQNCGAPKQVSGKKCAFCGTLVTRHRAARCEHGFYRGLCASSDCPHWDRVVFQKDAQKTRREPETGGKVRKPRDEGGGA